MKNTRTITKDERRAWSGNPIWGCSMFWRCFKIFKIRRGEVMRKYIIIFCVLTVMFASCKKSNPPVTADGGENGNGFQEDALEEKIVEEFICVDGPLRIRSGPALVYEAVGKLETGERAAVMGKTDYQNTIDGQTDCWYQIDFNGTQGYVFGWYGIVIASKIVINSVDDFVVKLPAKKMSHYPSYRQLFQWKGGEQKTVHLVYGLKLLDKDQYYTVYVEYRPKPSVETEYLIDKYRLELIDANPNFGMGDEYKIHTKPEDAEIRRRIENKYEPEGTFFVGQWGSGWSKDIMSVLFEKDINSDFDAVLITILDAYKGAMSDDLHADVILANRGKLIPELTVYQLLYEYFCNIKIDIDDAPASPRFWYSNLEHQATENESENMRGYPVVTGGVAGNSPQRG
jgi:hypothetical protein